ncbi:phosphatidate cytidylyltransferase [Thiomicrorhabdus indica]|uniref:phosphatidate cytidylyltransferase n=1 Tax=Thiomicrorhabdus indica TaxID=2267253 RepID=UPI00102DE0E9|nr:phosphatidate cytidylyltransferase [Thiomicrorhabdus indica]
MLKERLMTALVLVVLALVDIFFASAIVWEMTILMLSVLAAWEWSALAKVEEQSKSVLYAAFVTALTGFSIQTFTLEVFQILAIAQLLVFIGYVVSYQLKSGELRDLPKWINLSIGALSIVLFAYALVSLRYLYGPSVLLLVLLSIWAIDSGAYFSGKRFGKHKLAVHVSPGKTWEGVFGGAAFTFLFLLIYMSFFNGNDQVLILQTAFILSFVAMISVFGDLFESVLKRQAGLKDSGNLLPGHGGVLDRVDSLILALPLMLLVWLTWPSLAPVINH